ncbi:MAG: SUMF1/EgtB/PvdO family nonheme iron enzyme, partial [Myxococcales bacterium]|nr:SUMF1/EgtB/PvdO family nonheme iron enzyme [Myxococcales bacterium]
MLRSRVPVLFVASALVVSACADSRNGPGANAPARPTPTPEAPAPVVEPAPAPAPAPAPEPEPEPAPPPLTAPDGTVIADCGPVPEGMACIPGGPFIRGSDDGPKNTHPAETVWLQTYYMDLNEATVEEYKACLERGDCLKGGPLYNDFSRPKQPIVGPNWYAAVRYCEAHGKHL